MFFFHRTKLELPIFLRVIDEWNFSISIDAEYFHYAGYTKLSSRSFVN